MAAKMTSVILVIFKHYSTYFNIDQFIILFACLLTKSNMAAIGHIGKVSLFVSYTYIFNDFGIHNSFLMSCSSLGSIFMLTDLPNPIWRLSAILEKSSSLFLTPFSRAIPLVLLILVCRIHL